MMKTLFSLLFCTAILTGYSQSYLYLQKGNDVPYKRLKVYDTITFRTDSSSWAEGSIQAISLKNIRINGHDYLLSDITGFRTRHELLYISGTALAGGGLLFTGVAFVNSVINGETPLLTSGQVIFGTAMTGGGLLIRWLSRKTYLHEKGWEWKVISLDN